jgi:hypothetical protein
VDDDERYQHARRRVKELKGFYTNLYFYLAVNVFLVLVNIITSPGHWWFQWVLLGWGIGVVAHAISIFARPTWFGPEWEDRKAREIMEKEQRR